MSDGPTSVLLAVSEAGRPLRVKRAAKTCEIRGQFRRNQVANSREIRWRKPVKSASSLREVRVLPSVLQSGISSSRSLPSRHPRSSSGVHATSSSGGSVGTCGDQAQERRIQEVLQCRNRLRSQPIGLGSRSVVPKWRSAGMPRSLFIHGSASTATPLKAFRPARRASPAISGFRFDRC